MGEGWNVPCVGKRGVYSLLNEVCGQFNMPIEENVTVIVEERKIMKDRYMYAYIYVFMYLSERKVQQCVYILYCECVIYSAIYQLLCA